MIKRFGDAELKLIKSVIDEGDLSPYFRNPRGGKLVQQLESEFARYVGTDYAVAVSSGTTALQTAYLASGIKPNDRVIVPPHTFMATATMLLAVQARPVFADVLSDTYCLDPAKTEERVRSLDNVKGIVPVDLLGQPSDMEAFYDIARRKKLILIEDAAQVLGGRYKGKRAGSNFSDCSIWSGQYTKTWTMGEGGMITTNNREIYEKCLAIRSHGSHYLDSPYLTFNFRATELQAAVGLAQLKKFPDFLRQQVENAEYLCRNLPDSISAPYVAPYAEPSWYIIGCLTVDGFNRESFIEYMAKLGISKGLPGEVVSLGYTVPLYNKPILQPYGFHCPVAESLCKRWLWFDIHRWKHLSELKADVRAIQHFG